MGSRRGCARADREAVVREGNCNGDREGDGVMNTKKFAAILVALAVLPIGGWFRSSAKSDVISLPLKSVPTFSTANIGRQGHFYVGGKWVGEAGKDYKDDGIHMEDMLPHPHFYIYRAVFVTGGGGQ